MDNNTMHIEAADAGGMMLAERPATAGMNSVGKLTQRGTIDAAKLPGVLVKDNRAFYPLNNQLHPVVGAVEHRGKMIPILDIPVVDVPAGATLIPWEEVGK